MKNGFSHFAGTLALISLASFPGSLRGDSLGEKDPGSRMCIGRAVATVDGKPSDLDDCRLQSILDKAGLREHLLPCVETAQKATVRVYGGFGFEFDLHPDGGVSFLELQKSAFDRTALPACVRKRIWSCFGRTKAGSGVPGRITGHLKVKESGIGAFSLSIQSNLIRRVVSPRPLAGHFRQIDCGLAAACGLGGARLFLVIGGAARSGVNTVGHDGLPEEIEECEKDLDEKKSEDISRSERRKIRDKVCRCLVGLLDEDDVSLRASAAERIASGRHWRGRRALTAAIREMLKFEACEEGTECCYQAPEGQEAGLALLRMIKAQIRLRRFVKDETLEAMARHPAREVRLGLLRGILLHWRRELPPATGILIHDSDPVVRLLACNMGCQHADREARKIFLDELDHPDPVRRALAALHARSCFKKYERRILEAIRREPQIEVALLMLRMLPAPPVDLVLDRAKTGLLHACPVVRFLAGRLLGLVKNRPLGLIRRALAREPNAVLKQRLSELLGGLAAPQSDNVRLWLQTEP